MNLPKGWSVVTLGEVAKRLIEKLVKKIDKNLINILLENT